MPAFRARAAADLSTGRVTNPIRAGREEGLRCSETVERRPAAGRVVPSQAAVAIARARRGRAEVTLARLLWDCSAGAVPCGSQLSRAHEFPAESPSSRPSENTWRTEMFVSKARRMLGGIPARHQVRHREVPDFRGRSAPEHSSHDVPQCYQLPLPELTQAPPPQRESQGARSYGPLVRRPTKWRTRAAAWPLRPAYSFDFLASPRESTTSPRLRPRSRTLASPADHRRWCGIRCASTGV
jgi:hypothetical protein